ncbi:MAG: ATP-dependent Clp protease ATP-binding subunit ClpX, partial [Bdellovibrionales bacterium]|nr:ATP-dependent Clp protease ATP-binding subunit ClpX [Bdellovibrionales bacterium]
LDIMYEKPSNPDVKDCIITEEVITKGEKPQLVYGRKKETDKKSSEESAESA